MGQGINTVGKISTGIQGLDKMLLGGLQLPLISPEEDISSSEKGIIIVLKGDRGTDKTLVCDANDAWYRQIIEQFGI